MIRQTIISNTENITFTIPLEYIGKELEVIAFAKNEVNENNVSIKQATFNALSLKTKGFKFDRDIANER